MPVYDDYPLKVLVRKDPSGEWHVRPRRFGYPAVLRAKSFKAAIVMASALAYEMRRVAA